MGLLAINQPIIETERLVLRPFALTDAPDVQRLAGVHEIAATTAHIPHPYPDGAAEEWIRSHSANLDTGNSVTFAIVLRSEDSLCGAIGLVIQQANNHAELGYWIGVPYWGRGLCTEAAHAVIRYGFEDLGLNRIFAHHFKSNPASGRVMQKVGMIYEGCLRQHILKWGEYVDLKQYGMLRVEWLRQNCGVPLKGG